MYPFFSKLQKVHAGHSAAGRWPDCGDSFLHISTLQLRNLALLTPFIRRGNLMSRAWQGRKSGRAARRRFARARILMGQVSSMKPRIRPVVFKEPSSGIIKTAGVTPPRRLTTRFVWIVGILFAVALV